MISRSWLSVCSCFLMALGATPAAGDETVAVGVNVVNPQRLSAAGRKAVLEQLQSAGVHLIRVPLAPAWGAEDYAPAIDFVDRAYERGIKTDLIIGLQYREDAHKRPPVRELPKMWSSYPLSSADPARFRAVFQPLFNELEGRGVTFAALELGNEINWTAFNGDFPIPGEGRVFGREDLMRDPEARQIADGYRAYLQTLTVLKDIRDHSRRNRETPILSAGLSDPGPAGPRPASETDAVAIGATLQYLRANGVDALVDAYGVHAYPTADTAAGRLNQLEQYTLVECHPLTERKPCWLTEWGVRAAGTGCSGNDAPRAALVQELLGDFRQIVHQGRLKGLVYYSWGDEKYGIYRCGALTGAGRLALNFKVVQ
jgi:hypothetical protein